MARTGFTDSPSAILSPRKEGYTGPLYKTWTPGHIRSSRPRRRRVGRLTRRGLQICYDSRVKRVLAGAALLVLVSALVYGWAVTRRERRYQAQIKRGDTALAQGETMAAIEAFSG